MYKKTTKNYVGLFLMSQSLQFSVCSVTSTHNINIFRGSLELIFIELINFVSLEQLHHKPSGMDADGPLKGTTIVYLHKFVISLLK